MRSFFAALFLLFWAWPGQLQAESLLVVYPSRPPYNYTVEGKPAGVLFEIAARILKRSGLEVSYSEMPSTRIIKELQNSDKAICSFGWFKTPERESFANFSLPFYRDRPLYAIALKKNASLCPGCDTLKDLAKQKNVSFGLISNWVYGQASEILRTEETRIVDVPERSLQPLMLAAGRFTYTLVRESELDEIIELSRKPKEDFLIIKLKDAAYGEARYFMCSKKVGAQNLQAIDAAITSLGQNQ